MQPLDISRSGDVECQCKCVLDGITDIAGLIKETKAFREGHLAEDIPREEVYP